MIRIKPEPENKFLCPKCGQRPAIRGIVAQTILTLADCVCENCHFEFYQTFLIGHSIVDTLAVDIANKKLYPNHGPKTWLGDALLKAFCGERKGVVNIDKIIFRKHRHVIVLNTLDFLYGHVLLKLYNSIYHLDNHEDLGLVVILPKAFEWLVPTGCAEVWIVDLKLHELEYFHSSIQKYVTNELGRFDTVFLSKSYSHPDFTAIDIKRLTGIEPFKVNNFLCLKPAFTFVLREDRWWWSALPDYWFYRLCRKLGALKWGSRVLTIRQNGLVKRTIAMIRRKLPESSFFVVGLGTTGSFDGYALDERKNIINNSIEKDWCRIYARSHVVIGMHGSNMLLPTAHAAGCVEILPEDRYGNIIQDISVRYADRKQLYLYRFVEQFARPNTVANKAIAIISDFEIFERNMGHSAQESQLAPETMYTPLVDDAHR